MEKIEIFDEENSILLSDEDHVENLKFFPDTNEFKSTINIINDAYEINKLYEYKLSTDPIEVFIRLKEWSSAPPLHYAVKDGVVLEYEDQKEKHFWRIIDDLKKQVEWYKLELSGCYVHIFYILSKHPEIIPKASYRRFLRKTEQRIKIGLSNVEKKLKEKDITGLKIIKDESGNKIWYSNNKETSEEKQKEQSEYVENNFYTPLFNEKSSEYSGISKHEFERSYEILSHLDTLLNKKETLSLKKDNADEGKKSYWKWLSYAWTVIINLITIWVVLAIFNKVYGSFEIIVFSILILIYLSFQSFSMIYSKTITETIFGLDAEFKRIRKLLKDEPNKYEKEEMQEVKKKIDKAMVKMYINSVFMFIIYLIALFHLFSAL